MEGGQRAHDVPASALSLEKCGVRLAHSLMTARMRAMERPLITEAMICERGDRSRHEGLMLEFTRPRHD